MHLDIRSTNRWATVAPDTNPTAENLRDEIWRGEGTHSDFTLLSVPAPPRDETVFKVCGNDRELLVAIALFSTNLDRLAAQAEELPDTVEMFFDPRHDHLGWSQFILPPTDEPTTLSFLPYPEAHTSNYPLMALRRYESHTETIQSATNQGWRCRWVFAWFDTAEVFRHSSVVGFNITRTRPPTLEFSSWNFCSGNGFQDATAFGHLHRTAPTVELANLSAAYGGGTLRLGGSSSAPLVGPLRVTAPCGETFDVVVSNENGAWESRLEIENAVAGRYHVEPIVKDVAVEPASFSFDIEPLAAAHNRFLLSMTYDPPMSVIPNYYTPDRLRAEMAVLKEWGIGRIHWIENPADWATFWEHERWGENYAQTTRHCGDFLTCAAAQAHANGLELYATWKVFDLGFNMWFLEEKSASTVREIEGRYVSLLPDIADHQEWTLQANPAWQSKPSFPVTRLRFYSDAPLPTIDPARVRLLISDDNRAYRAYDGTLLVRQGQLERPHYRWTPSGKVAAEGAANNWFLELADLRLHSLFAALQIEGDEFHFMQRGYMVVEAEDAAGNTAPVTVATTGHRDFTESGYFFWKEWQDWVNSTEAILQHRSWSANNFGLTFQEMPNMTTLLEPTYEGARAIWLARVTQMLDAGVDGIDMRILCHHNGPMSYLKYAFAPVVCETFQSLHGRPPQETFEDYERIRRIRGDAFTQFLRDAKKLIAARGKKLATHLESGIEVPLHYDTRMQFHLDYRTWIEEGIIDEIQLKYWTAHSPFVHREIMPLARRHGVPVHIISRCLENGLDHRGTETVPQLVADAHAAGFDGFNFYETDNLIELNPQGIPTAKGLTAPAFRSARRVLGQ